MKTTAIVLGIAVLTAAVSLTAIAGGERTNIQGMGMARTFVAHSRGLDAVGINPANLAAEDGGRVTLGLMPVGIHVGSDFLTYGLYTKYFTGEESSTGRVSKHLTNQDKQDILATFPDGVGRISAHLEARPIGLSVRIGEHSRVALTMTEYVTVNAMVPHDYMEFMFYGNTPGSTYEFGQTSAYASWMREYALSYGMNIPALIPVKSLSVGAAVKLVHGFGYFEMDRFNTVLSTGTDGILHGNVDVHGRASGIDPLTGAENANFQPFPAPAGSGLGFDLGVASDVNDYLCVGMSITDIGSVKWTANVEELVSNGQLEVTDPLSQDQRDSIENAVMGEHHPGAEFSTALPTTFRVGAAVELHKVPFLQRFLWGEWTFACDFNQGLVDGAGISATSRFSMGLEFRPWGFLPLRTGASFGGSDHFNFALGFGLHFGVFDLDLASEHLNFLLSEESLSHGSMAVGMRIRI
jgi:hypothetical protein